MWKLKCAQESKNSALLRSLNNFQGRQLWEWDADAGTAQERAAVKKAQEQYTANRHHQKHSADLLLRLQSTGSIEEQSIKGSRATKGTSWLCHALTAHSIAELMSASKERHGERKRTM